MKLFFDDYNDTTYTDFEDIAVISSRDKPQWFKDIKPYISKYEDQYYENIFAVAKKDWNGIFEEKYGKTIKVCPGMHSLFRHTLLLKFPENLFLETTAAGNYRWRIPEANRLGNSLLTVQEHNSRQAVGFADNYIIIKFCYNVFIKPDEEINLSFLDPILYNDQPYKVLPGIVELGGKRKGVQLNIICLLPKKDEKYIFKKNTVLCMIQSSKIIKSISKEDLSKDITKSMKGID